MIHYYYITVHKKESKMQKEKEGEKGNKTWDQHQNPQKWSFPPFVSLSFHFLECTETATGNGGVGKQVSQTHYCFPYCIKPLELLMIT